MNISLNHKRIKDRTKAITCFIFLFFNSSIAESSKPMPTEIISSAKLLSKELTIKSDENNNEITIEYVFIILILYHLQLNLNEN